MKLFNGNKNILGFVSIFILTLIVYQFSIIKFEPTLEHVLTYDISPPIDGSLIFAIFQYYLRYLMNFWDVIVVLLTSFTVFFAWKIVKSKFIAKILMAVSLLLLLVGYFAVFFSFGGGQSGGTSVPLPSIFFPFVLLRLFGAILLLVVITLIPMLLIAFAYKLYGLKLALPLLIIVLILNIYIGISKHSGEIEKINKITEGYQETMSHLGHIYRPPQEYYKSNGDAAFSKGGQELCVIFIARDCALLKGKYYFHSNYTSGDNHGVNIYQFEASDYGEDATNLANKMRIISEAEGPQGRCKVKLTTLNEIFELKEPALYGLIEQLDGKCDFQDEIHFLLIYKEDALIVIKDQARSYDNIVKVDLLKIAESLR